MKRKVIAILLLHVFVFEIAISCTSSLSVDEGTRVLNALSQRFEANDYIEMSMRPANPYEETGMLANRVFQEIVVLPAAKQSRSVIGNPIGATFPEKLESTKASARMVLSKLGIEASDAQLNQFNDRVKNYRFLANDLEKFMSDMQAKGHLTAEEKKILYLEITELSTVKSLSRLQRICATVEFEVNHSDLSEISKSKLNLFNSIMRNLYSKEFLRLTMSKNDPSVSTSVFQTVAIETLTAGVLIIVGIISLAEAFLDPNCTQTCQGQLVANGVAMIGAGALICCCAENNYGYTPCDQQYIP